MIDYVIYYFLQNINRLVLGNFKWTILGGLLGSLAVFMTWGLTLWIKSLWIKKLAQIVLFVGFWCLFIWFGHELVDPWFHQQEVFWVTPLGEKMIIVK